MTTHQDVGKKLTPVVEDRKCEDEDNDWNIIRSKISSSGNDYAQTCWREHRFVKRLSTDLGKRTNEALPILRELLVEVSSKHRLDLLTCYNGALSSNVFKILLSSIPKEKDEDVAILGLDTLEKLVQAICNVLLEQTTTSDDSRRTRLLRLWGRLPRFLSSLLNECKKKKLKIPCLSLVKTACEFASKHALELGSLFYAEMLASEPTLPNTLCTYMQDIPEQTIRVLSVLLDTSETYNDVFFPLETYASF